MTNIDWPRLASDLKAATAPPAGIRRLGGKAEEDAILHVAKEHGFPDPRRLVLTVAQEIDHWRDRSAAIDEAVRRCRAWFA